MSKNKRFSDTSASRYSLALYELANETSVLIKVEENSSAILKLISLNKEFNNIEFKNFRKKSNYFFDSLQSKRLEI